MSNYNEVGLGLTFFAIIAGFFIGNLMRKDIYDGYKGLRFPVAFAFLILTAGAIFMLEGTGTAVRCGVAALILAAPVRSYFKKRA